MAEPGQERSENQKSAAEIEREVDQTRAEIDHTLGEIYERLTPGDLFEHAVGYLRNSRAFGRIGVTVRDNPVPAVLTIVGIGWLILAGLRSSRVAGEGFRPSVPNSRMSDRQRLIPAGPGETTGPGARVYWSERETVTTALPKA